MQVITAANRVESANQIPVEAAPKQTLWIETRWSGLREVMFDDEVDSRIDKRLRRLVGSLDSSGDEATVQIIEKSGESRVVHYDGGLSLHDIRRFYRFMEWWIELTKATPGNSLSHHFPQAVTIGSNTVGSECEPSVPSSRHHPAIDGPSGTVSQLPAGCIEVIKERANLARKELQ